MDEKRLVDINTINVYEISYESPQSIREYLKGYEPIDPETLPIVKELREEIKKLNDQIEVLNQDWIEDKESSSWRYMALDFAKKLEQVTEERDCAVKDLKSLENGSLCSICKYFDSPYTDLCCADCKGTPDVISDCFEWRGKGK